MGLRLVLGIGLSALTLGLTGLGASAQQPTGKPIVVGQRFELRSETMSEVRGYLVHRPPHYEISRARYPVLIVLDGPEHFQLVSATVDLLSEAGKIPPMLVVGVANTNRFRDMDSAVGPGSSPFLTFITNELLPAIDRDYRTHPYRILAGHSGAALFTLYTMVNAPEAFRSYIVIAPAFGDHRELPKIVDAFFQGHKDPNLNVDVFLAADDSPGMGLSGAWELSSYLNERATRVRDLRFTFRHYAESHATVPLLGVYEGLQSSFFDWELSSNTAVALYEQGGFAAIDEHYAALSARLGFPVAVPKQVMLQPFFRYEGGKRFAEAEQVIESVVATFPDDPLTLYYAGRLYMQMGNTPFAVETLKKALALRPNDPASRALLQYMKIDPSEFVPELRLTATELAKYVGGYGTSAVLFEIERRGDQLVGRTSEQEYELSALSATTFRSSAGIVSFRFDERGRVTGLEFDNGGAELAKLK